jgi:hypothetical protein
VAEQKRYLLRSTSGLAKAVIKAPVYLTGVRKHGLETRWIPDPRHARKFTLAQRAALENKYPHVIGRWVCADKALSAYGVEACVPVKLVEGSARDIGQGIDAYGEHKDRP